MPFYAIEQWLPITCLVRHDQRHQDSVQDISIFDNTLADDPNANATKGNTPRDFNDHLDEDSTPTYEKNNDDDSLPPMPDKNANTIDSIIPLPPLPHIMDISKIFTQNVHGLWCQAQDQDGRIIPNCKCDMAKLEHLIHRMQSGDIDAWLIQEIWLEDGDFNTNIDGYHMFRTNSPVGSTGRNHLFCGVAVILSPDTFLHGKLQGPLYQSHQTQQDHLLDASLEFHSSLNVAITKGRK